MQIIAVNVLTIFHLAILVLYAILYFTSNVKNSIIAVFNIYMPLVFLIITFVVMAESIVLIAFLTHLFIFHM